MPRDFQLPGRSPVIACDGMAATSHPLATLAAVDALRAGGSAADAAVAAVATLCVVEPHMTGIGGDCYCLVSQPGKPVWGYNGSGRAGAKASFEALRAQGLREIGDSIHAVTVPGALDAWEAILKTHGRFGLDRALAPAIKYAEGGFPVAPRVAWDWQRYVGKLKADPGAAKHYLFNGAAPKEGDVIRFPALAATLKTIAAKGARAFYEGEIAADMAATVAARGSFLTAEDFARHRGDAVTPISTNYRGLDLVEIPPNGQGLTALVMLNILENFDLAALDPLGPERFHLVLEAARLGFAVRDTHIADAAHMRIAVADLLDKGFGKKLAALIDMKRRAKLPAAPTPGSDTVYLTVVDRDRMAVSFINSLYSHFGVGICTEKTGILLTNRGACFTLEADHPNTFGPDKRPMHTIIPALAMRGGPLRHELRRHGRALPADGPRADRPQHAGLRHGRAAGDRRAAFLLRGRADGGRNRHAGGDHRGPQGARPRRGVCADALGRRADHQDRLGSRRADRRLGAAQGRLRARC